MDEAMTRRAYELSKDLVGAYTACGFTGAAEGPVNAVQLVEQARALLLEAEQAGLLAQVTEMVALRLLGAVSALCTITGQQPDSVLLALNADDAFDSSWLI